MVTMFVGGVVMMLDRIIVLFLLYETYRAGVFLSRPNPNRGKALNKVPYAVFNEDMLKTASQGPKEGTTIELLAKAP